MKPEMMIEHLESEYVPAFEIAEKAMDKHFPDRPKLYFHGEIYRDMDFVLEF